MSTLPVPIELPCIAAPPAQARPLRLVPGNALWPPEYDSIEGRPTALWIRGRHELLRRRPCVAIVGTRSPTPYGAAQAARFARTLASAGAVIVSGLARGIDHCAHEAALEVGGATVAVLGSGVDQPWPVTPLVDRLLEHGLLLSEFEPGTPARRFHFPLRNRLISGLASTVVVIEAAQASGSLITARWAIDQGKQVAALPGRVDHPMSRGCHRLLREGAQLVEDPEELALELGLGPPALSLASGTASESGADPDDGDGAASTPLSTSASMRLLLELLRGETLSGDELAERARRRLSDVLVELVELELAGRVMRLPGGLYRLTER